MNIIKYDMGSECDSVILYPIGDIHMGSNHHVSKEFAALIDEINNTPNAVVILNGDLVNNTIKTSIGDIYEEKLTPEQSIDELVRVLTPIKDKIIGVTTGNHEVRTQKLTGIDILKNLCYRLDCMDKYNSISNVIFLSFGKHRGRDTVRNTFSIYHTHGTGGGRTVGAKSNGVHRLSQVIQADIYIHSHTHTPLIFKENYIMSNCGNKGIKEVSRMFINTNAYEGFGGYGEAMKLPPSNREWIKIKLSADNRGNKIMRGVL